MGTPRDYIVVNGARIERSFFEESLAEARQLEWVSSLPSEIVGHRHCIICMKAIPDGRSKQVFRSDNRWIDAYCYATFVANQ